MHQKILIMKKSVLIIFVTGLILISCKKNTETVKPAENSKDSITEATESKTGFDINSVPVSDKELGDFPFFSFPQGMEALNTPLQRSYDQIYFPIDGVFTPIEGKSWKSYVAKSEGSNESWSLPYFEKSYDEAIKAAGGVKIYDGKVSDKELEKLKQQAKYLGEEGSIDYWNEPVKVYLIRRPAGDDIYIQLYGNTSSGALQILQKAPFKQTITMIKSDQIQKDLDEKGKSVLHINFDTDKATLQPDGIEAIAEITKVLNNNKTLKLDINGYTDNSGNNAHNLQLSKDRANTVLNTLVTSGIDKSRLKANGFGAENPIAPNTSEDGKAQNRRVELVKK